MGKATELTERLLARPLTQEELAAREADARLGDEHVQPTLDGTFVTQVDSDEPVEVLRAPEQTWD